MIKTEKNITEMQGKLWQVESEFSITVTAMKKYLCNKIGMTEEEAKARVAELVERGFKSQKELEKEVHKEMEKLLDIIFGDAKEESDEKVQ